MPASAYRVALALAVLAGASPAARAAAQEAKPGRPLAALAFIAGCWRGDGGVDKVIEEQWTAADSDVMLGTTRNMDEHTRQTRSWEFSRIVAERGGIFLLPAPRGVQQGRFRLTALAAGDARFEDPAHDDPKRIRYRRIDARRLAIHVDAGEGDREGQEWELERVACPSPPAR